MQSAECRMQGSGEQGAGMIEFVTGNAESSAVGAPESRDST